MYVHSFNVVKKNIQMQVLHLGLTDTEYVIFVSLTALAGHIFVFFV